MHNKSLEDHLFIREVSPLSWMARLRIARDAARGLAHLHEEKDFQIIFRDLKTSSILLDENFNAKFSDFGPARQGPAAGLSHISTTSVVGTAGYAAPKYIQTGRLTAKSDVWSFGVVLYVLITGRRAVEKNMPRNEQKLLDWNMGLVLEFLAVLGHFLYYWDKSCSSNGLHLFAVALKIGGKFSPLHYAGNLQCS
ncbi:hypothetical protein RHMOL_Rhmol01G0309500 [Rhododendron molle]|uniref:Uncharacterized protein n=1 Tax=Rhododendron molle TaxID=49168 RepID=A0ACC0Q8V9_RHOML|nr:hypothetical protein RHMOL_Rhmol01G0309500 [Rhododendron molle]